MANKKTAKERLEDLGYAFKPIVIPTPEERMRAENDPSSIPGLEDEMNKLIKLGMQPRSAVQFGMLSLAAKEAGFTDIQFQQVTRGPLQSMTQYIAGLSDTKRSAHLSGHASDIRIKFNNKLITDNAKDDPLGRELMRMMYKELNAPGVRQAFGLAPEIKSISDAGHFESDSEYARAARANTTDWAGGPAMVGVTAAQMNAKRAELKKLYPKDPDKRTHEAKLWLGSMLGGPVDNRLSQEQLDYRKGQPSREDLSADYYYQKDGSWTPKQSHIEDIPDDTINLEQTPRGSGLQDLYEIDEADLQSKLDVTTKGEQYAESNPGSTVHIATLQRGTFKGSGFVDFAKDEDFGYG